MARRKKPVTKEFTYTAVVRGTVEERVLQYREMLKTTEGRETKVIVVENWTGPHILKGAKLRKLLLDAGALQPAEAPSSFIPHRKFDSVADVNNRSW